MMDHLKKQIANTGLQAAIKAIKTEILYQPNVEVTVMHTSNFKVQIRVRQPNSVRYFLIKVSEQI